MDFGSAVSTCMHSYADFNGRAQRSEFWWFQLFVLMVTIAAQVLETTLRMGSAPSTIASLALFVPSIAVGARRLHDTDRTGWWQLMMLVPLIGWLLLIIFQAERGNAGRNRYG